MVSLNFFLLTAIVASIAFADLLRHLIALLSVFRLEFVKSLLESPKVLLQILVDLSHLEVLLLEVLAALVCLTKLLV